MTPATKSHVRAAVITRLLSLLLALALLPTLTAYAATGGLTPLPPNYAVGSYPLKEAVGDFNRDGFPDLVVVNSNYNNGNATGVSNVSVLLGNGDGSFHAAVNYNAGANPSDVAIADFDGDGKLDLAITNFGSNNVSILLGNGNGTFRQAVNYQTGTAPRGLVIGDFNRDGKLDLAIANYGGNNISVLLGNGDGSFQSATNYAVGIQPNSLLVGDFNGDGKKDLAVANTGSNNVSILLGNGDGTFRVGATLGVGSKPIGLTVADFNNDGKLDLAVANSNFQGSGISSISVLLGNGDGSFQPAVNYTAGTIPISVAVGDFNGDGKLDLAVANQDSNDVSILLGNGNGTFQPAVNYSNGTRPQSVVVSDFNGDGKLDLAVSNAGFQGSGNVSILLGRGDGSFSAPRDFNVDLAPFFVTEGDFNGDGLGDLVTANEGSNDISVMLGNGDGTFQPAVNYPAGLRPYAATVGDFNGDGKQDVAVVDQGGSVGVFLGNGDGTFQSMVNTPVSGQVVSIASGDFNADGKLDLAVADSAGLRVIVLLGKGNGTFQPAVVYPAGSSVVSVTVADFNGDGKPDLLLTDSTGNSVNVLLNNGNGTFAAAVAYPAGASPSSVVAGDFNGDGHLDLAVGNNVVSGTVSVLKGNGNGSFQSAAPFAAGFFPFFAATADFNGDGKLDLAVANHGFTMNGGGGSISLFMGGGDGTFQLLGNYGIGAGPRSVAVADFNGDGAPDVAVSNQYGNNVSILLNTVGTFVSVVTSGSPSSFNQPVTFTATVAASVQGSGTPSGTVSFKDGNTLMGTVNLTAGQATITVSGLSIGSHAISAVYSGDNMFNPHTTLPINQVVNQAATSSGVTSSLNPSIFGQSVTFTATVMALTSGIPTGTVTFLDGASVLGNGAVNGTGQATLTTSALTAGSHSITAFYGGDTNYKSSASAISQTVLRVSTTTLVSSINPSAFGQSVAFTATVTSGATGTVSFLDGSILLGTAALDSNSQAAFSTAAFSAGSHSITAVYSGDTSFAGSTSTVLIQTVNGIPNIALAVSHAPDPIPIGGKGTFAATVTNNSSFTVPNVVFSETLNGKSYIVSTGTTVGGPCTVNGLTVTCSLGSMTTGAKATITVTCTPLVTDRIVATATVNVNTTSATDTARVRFKPFRF